MTRRDDTMTSGTHAPAAGTVRPAPGWLTLALRIVGPGLLIASGAIHLDLYLTGYRSIPTIGWLFLLQVIAAFALGLAAAALRGWLAPALAAGFSLATLGGYLLSVWVGLFGFTEVRTTAGIVAGVLEVAAFAALAALALTASAQTASAPPGATPDRGPLPATVPGQAALPGWVPVRAAGMAAAGLAVVALVLLGVAVAGAGGGPAQPAAASGALKTTTINGTSVLTNANGRTLYWFAPDSAATSKCYGSCAAYWPPVPGHATAGPGVTGTLGTIQRTGGGTQATYDGHPLYTYIGDKGPGQASGNNLNLNGGLWHVVPAAGG